MTEKARPEVSSFTFKDFNSVDANKVTSFEFKDLKSQSMQKNKIDEKVIRVEREMESGSAFRIFDTVKEHRGLKNQAENDFQERLAQELEAAVSKIREEAYEEGFSKGQEDGHEQAHAESKKIFSKQVEEIRQTLESIQQQRLLLIQDNQTEMYRMIKSLVKWVSLKEMSDLSYLPKLLEKLILELNERHNLLIKVSRGVSERMPDIVKLVESRIGTLSNVRIEITPSLEGPGLVLESEKGILDAGQETLFKSIDKIFETVGKENEHPGV